MTYPYRNVLLIADQPEDEKPLALKRAAALTGPGSRITVAAFVHDAGLERLDYHAPDESAELKQRLLAQRNDWLRDQLRDFDEDDVSLTSEVVWARDIAYWVREAVEQNGFDLIIKTGHRSETLWHRSTDWELIEQVAAPVYIASTRQWKAQPNILATVDIASERADQQRLNEAVMEQARRVAELQDGEVHLAYIIQVSRILLELEGKNTEEYRAEYEKKHAGRLDAFCQQHGIDPDHVHVEVGQADRRVPSIADRIKASCVVVGRSARQGPYGLIFGSTAERVLSVLRTDILSVPAD